MNHLPSEVLYLIFHNIEQKSQQRALLLCCRRLYEVLQPDLYLDVGILNMSFPLVYELRDVTKGLV